jgi:clan AA aspartic protease
MGITHVTTTVWNLAKDGCLVPAEALAAAGVKVERKKVYELANGQPVEYEVGFARIEFMGEETVAQVIFGPSHAEPILGVVALENTGIIVDPTTNSLKWLPALPLK